MVDERKEVELLGLGMDLSVPERPAAWFQNLVRRKGAWVTRPGFGQIAQLDTSLGYIGDSLASDCGPVQHLGSYIHESRIGHTQILSAFKATIYTADSRGFETVNGRWTNAILVHIYDLTTDTWWEELLHVRTAEQSGSGVPVEKRHAHFETTGARDFDATLTAKPGTDQETPPNSSDYFFFKVLNDIVLFGSSAAGLWAYIPCIFGRNRRKQTQPSKRPCLNSAHGESSVLTPIVAANGSYSDRFTYLTQTTFPRPNCAATLGARVVYAQDRSVYFSDEGRPNVIAARNYIDVPSRASIQALASVGGNLVIWSGTEMFVYQPNLDYIVSLGRLERVSDTIGCLGPNAICSLEQSIVWADQNGVYTTSSGTNAQSLTDKTIKTFFQEQITNPLTHYYSEGGFTNLSQDQPRMAYDFTQRYGVQLAYDPKYRTVLMSVPSLGIAWAWNGEWTLWNFESMVNVVSGAPKVGATRNIKSPWLLASKTDVYLVGSVDTQTVTDGATNPRTGGPRNQHMTERSYYILQLGRGGGLDRSIETEDYRTGKARWERKANGGSSQIIIWFGELKQLPPGKTIYYHRPLNGAIFSFVADGSHYLLPISVCPNGVTGGTAYPGMTAFDVAFSFDSTNWEPVVPVATEVGFVLPSEKLGQWEGYMWAGPTPGYCHTVDDATWTNPTAGTQTIRVRYEHVNITDSFVFDPDVSADLPDWDNPCIYLCMKYKGLATVNSMAIGQDESKIYKFGGGGVISADLNVFETTTWKSSDRNLNDKAAQPVDWVHKSAQIGFQQGYQMLARGIFARLMSHGASSNQIAAGWPWGLYNVILGADWKEWVSAIVDYAGSWPVIERIIAKPTVRARFKPSTTMQPRIFRGTATWGTSSDSTKGNFLVGDEQIDTIATSDSVRGEHFSYMLFGHVRDKAEQLLLLSARAVLQRIGGRRRIGR